jgi:hypothetical protein
MPRKNNRVPPQETRGGNRPDWRHAKPGEPLPELPPPEYPEPDSEAIPQLAYEGGDTSVELDYGPESMA